jgi:hypothetical protein
MVGVEAVSSLVVSAYLFTLPPENEVRSGLSAGGKWIRTIGSWSRDQTVMGGGPGCLEKGADLLGTEGSNPPPSSGESAANSVRNPRT